ncbi:MAG: DNA repair and recombination protein RadB [Thermoplasmataceae archaeon]
MWKQMEKTDLKGTSQRLSSRVACIDAAIGGGLEPSVISEIFGEGGAGKTNLALIFSLSAIADGKSVFYIDAEGLSVDRLRQVYRGGQDGLESFIIYRVSSLDDQETAIQKVYKMLEKSKSPGLVVVDSFTQYVRLEAFQDFQERSAAIQRQLSLLNGIAMRFKIPVLITNQIYQDPDTGSLNPYGGFVIDHMMKAIFRLEKIGNSIRVISIAKHRSLPEQSTARFKITDYGISCEVD